MLGSARMRPVFIAALFLVARPTWAAVDAELAALLQKTGAIETERAGITCRWNETTRLEELDGEGRTKGSVTRTYTVTSRGPEVLSRVRNSERIEGDLSSLLRDERPRSNDHPKERLSPFH